MRMRLVLTAALVAGVTASFFTPIEGQERVSTPPAIPVLTEKPEIGRPFKPRYESSDLFVAGSAQMYPSYDVRFDSVRYVIGIDDRQRMAWIYTSDDAFASPEGLRVGDPLRCALEASDDLVRSELGWAWHVLLRSGWHAMVNAPPAEGDERRLLVPTHDRLEVPENAVVVAFFKRR